MIAQDQDFLDQVKADFERLSPEDIDYLDEHCHETGQPGRDRAAWIKLHGPASTPEHPPDA